MKSVVPYLVAWLQTSDSGGIYLINAIIFLLRTSADERAYPWLRSGYWICLKFITNKAIRYSNGVELSIMCCLAFSLICIISLTVSKTTGRFINVKSKDFEKLLIES